MYTNINLPARIEVDDYHEFASFQRLLRQIIPRVKVVEVSCLGPRNYGVVYIGNKQEPEVQKIINDIKEEVKKWEEDWEETGNYLLW